MKIFSIIMIVYSIMFYIVDFIKTKDKKNIIKVLFLLPILIEVIR